MILALVLLIISTLPFLAAGALLVALPLNADAIPPEYEQQLTQAGLTPETLLTALRGAAAVILALAVLYLLFAVLAFLGRNWARIVLTIMTVGFTLLLLAGMFTGASGDTGSLVLILAVVAASVGGSGVAAGGGGVASSRPPTRNFSCCQTKPSMSEVVKNLRAASPRAKWKIDAPTIIVLSTSKNAAAVRSVSGDAEGRCRRPPRRPRRRPRRPGRPGRCRGGVDHTRRLRGPDSARRTVGDSGSEVSSPTTCGPPRVLRPSLLSPSPCRSSAASCRGRSTGHGEHAGRAAAVVSAAAVRVCRPGSADGDPGHVPGAAAAA